MPSPKTGPWLLGVSLGGIGAGTLLVLLSLFLARTPDAGIPAYAGSESCRACHAAQYDAWKGSDHARALGWNRAGTPPFAPDLAGKVSAWAVEPAPDGVRLSLDESSRTFLAASAIGIDPIVQYLAEFPGGRFHALPVAFDPAKREWLDMTGCPEAFAGPAEPAPWDSREAAANTACLYCHTTGYEKNYDADRDLYASRWHETGVGCESCHGPAEPHARWQAEHGRSGEKDPFAAGLRRTGKPLVETCGACHARRMELDDTFRPGDSFADHFILELLATGTYEPDGRIRGEVYEIGSFLQSGMHAKGITCNDCHDPHSGRTRLAGNALCLTCHDKALDTPAHTLHAAGSAGASCVACHMPGTTFMKRDFRRDHSFSVPEPELTVRLGIPNACNECHTDKTPQWASERLRAAFGPADERRISRAEAVTQARARDPKAVGPLLALLADAKEPPIRRGTHAVLLAPFAERPEVRSALAARLSDPDAIVRMAAARALGSAPGFPRELAPLLADTQRAVRHEAAAALAPYAKDLPPADQDAFSRASAEYARAQLFHADQPAGRFNLGLFHDVQGRSREAARWYEGALALDPSFTAAAVNLGMMRAKEGDTRGAEQAFRRALAGNPRDAPAAFNLGLLLAESGRLDTAIDALERAVASDPAFPRAAYNLGVALTQAGSLARAVEVLGALSDREPTPEHLWALATVHVKRGDAAAASECARKILTLDPAHAGALEILRAAGE